MPRVSQNAQGGSDKREESRLQRVSEEIARRAEVLAKAHEVLQREVVTGRSLVDGGRMSVDDLGALSRYVDRRIKADDKIQEEYSRPGHPFWKYKCAGEGIDCFNLRILCPGHQGGIRMGFVDTFSGCFCTKYLSHMLDFSSTPEETISFVEQAERIGHPFEIVFVPEGQETAVEQLQEKGLIENSRVILWMNVLIDDPPPEERKATVRSVRHINAIGSGDMSALYYPPNKSGAGVNLEGNLTGLDQLLDLARAGNLVEIEYEKERDRPPYKLIPKKSV
ncbi:MAG: hypothetical protein ABH851_03715 [Methanobacteriota archaeon]